MSNYDKNYSYVEMMDAFHAGRKSMLDEIQFSIKPESGTWALQWIDEYAKSRDSDLEIREIDNRVEQEMEDRSSHNEIEEPNE